MAISNEEQRALNYQQQLLARDRYRTLAEASLHGSVSLRLQLRDAWAPIVHRNDVFHAGEHS